MTDKVKSSEGDVLQADEDVTEAESAVEARPAWAGARRQKKGNVRERILKSLRNVEEGDQLIEGTDVGYKQLVKLMDFLDKLESAGRGTRFKMKVQDLLNPVEMDDGFQFDAEGVTKLISFLEERPAGDGARQGGGAGRAGAWGRGGGQRGRRQAAGFGMQGRRGQGPAAAGPGMQQRRGQNANEIREVLEELKEKVEKLSKPSE